MILPNDHQSAHFKATGQDHANTVYDVRGARPHPDIDSLTLTEIGTLQTRVARYLECRSDDNRKMVEDSQARVARFIAAEMDGGM